MTSNREGVLARKEQVKGYVRERGMFHDQQEGRRKNKKVASSGIEGG